MAVKRFLFMCTALLLVATTAAAQSVTVDLAPQDTYLNLDTVNYSTAPTLYAYTWPAGKVGNVILLTVDLSAIPAVATVTAATLRLTLIGSDTFVDGAYAMPLYQVVTRTPDVSRATGLTADGVTPWTPNATCCWTPAIPMAQSDLSPVRATALVDRVPGVVVTWDATTIVQGWVATPSTNLGLVLNPDTAKVVDAFRAFASTEDPVLANRPVLRVAYTTGTPPPPISDLGPATRLAWEVSADVLLSAQSALYTIFVDTLPQPTVSTCMPAVVPNQFTCDTAPPTAAYVVGTHTLDVSSTFSGTERLCNCPISVTQVATSTLVPPLPPTGVAPRKP